MTPPPMLQVHPSYARAVLSDDSAAGPFYADLVGQDLTRWPWDRARAGMRVDASPPPSSTAL